MSRVSFRLGLGLVALLVVFGGLAVWSDGPAMKTSPSPVHQLGEFGDLGPKHLQGTYQKAITALRKTGGVLVVPAEEWKSLQGKQLPLQGLERTPAPPAETKRWANSPGVT